MNPAEISLLLVAATVVLTLFGFWVWMLVDCLTREPNEGKDRLVWTFVIVFTKFVGAALYFFMRYRKRNAPPLGNAGTGLVV